MIARIAALFVIPVVVVSFSVVSSPRSRVLVTSASTLHAKDTTSQQEDLGSIASKLNAALESCQSEVTKTCKVNVAPSPSCHRLGLIATQDIKKGEVVVNVPYNDQWEFTASLARSVFNDFLDEDYEGWTGDAGLVALMVLNELARVAGSGIPLPKRGSEPLQEFIGTWMQALPTPHTTELHPLLWSEEDQEVLQSSSNTKIYRALDDVEEDYTWLEEKVFSKDRSRFPESVSVDGKDDLHCFSLKGYQWAMSIVQSRSVFVDGSLRMLPVMDFANHDDDAEEISGGSMGRFGTTKGAQLVASRKYSKGEEVFCSYGPKSAADYLLEHGFCPPQCWKQAVSELTLELDPEGRFYYDKLDILEYETYDQAPMDPVQSFDVVSVPGRDGEPDPAMIQFARLCQLGETDAFLMESIFRKDVWGFMSLPVSERNELKVIEWLTSMIKEALGELEACPEGGPDVCNRLRESEMKALTRTMEFLLREKEALDLKEYYQERRLKDLGLDSEWSPEDDGGPDLGFGQTRAPGGADYDF